MKALFMASVFTLVFSFAGRAAADACADQKAALQQRAQALQAKIDSFNRECGGQRTKSEYLSHNCQQRGPEIDAENAAVDRFAKEYAARCQ